MQIATHCFVRAGGSTADHGPEMRAALRDVPRFIAICRTAKHFVFQFVTNRVLVESKIVAIALDDAFAIDILSSKLHIT